MSMVTTYLKQPREELTIAAFRKAVHERAGRRCELRLEGCQGTSTQAHHILRRGQGGTNTLTNGMSLCTSCHELVHGVGVITGVSYQKGWLQRRYPKPGDHHFQPMGD